MGQNQSYEAIDKTVMVSPTEEIVVSSNNCENESFDKIVEQNSSSNYRVSHTNEPIFAFISGFYQQPSDSQHIFFNLSFDTIYRIADYSKNWKILPYTGNPEEKGIIYWIGCANGIKEFINPITQHWIDVVTSHEYHVNYSRSENAVYRVLEYPNLVDKDCYFDPGCVIFHFPNYLISPTGYSLRNGGGRGSVLRRWVLEAAKDLDGPWTIISNHPGDDSFYSDVFDGQDKEKSFLVHCWEIKQPENRFFSYFKLKSLHTHTDGRAHAFYISGFELYGTVRYHSK